MIRTIASALAAFALVSFAAHADAAKVEAKEEKKETAVAAKQEVKADKKAEKKHGQKKAAVAPKAAAVAK